MAQPVIYQISFTTKYDPMGNRVYKIITGSSPNTYKYSIDIAGKLPTILCETDTVASSLTKSYIYSPAGQIICQRDGGQAADEYFYVTDRIGSVKN